MFDFIAIALAIVGGAIAFETIDNWSQWVVLGAIIFTLIGFMIALSPNRRGACGVVRPPSLVRRVSAATDARRPLRPRLMAKPGALCALSRWPGRRKA